MPTEAPPQIRHTVFIADDNDVARAVLRGIVRQDESLLISGEASNGQATLDGVAATEPDVLCLDIQMPKLDGLAVLEQVRDKAPHTRVVIVTGYATPDIVRHALAGGAAGFIVKPFNASTVLNAMHAALATKPPS